MLNRLLHDGGLYFIGGLVNRSIYLCLIPVYASYLSITEYAIVELGFIIANIVSVILVLEINQAIYRFVPEFSDSPEIGTWVCSALLFVFFMYLGFALVSLFAVFYLIPILPEDFIGPFSVSFFPLALTIVSTGLSVFLFTLLRARLLPWHYCLVSFVSAGVIFVVTKLLIEQLAAGVNGAFWGLTLGNFAGFVLGVLSLRMPIRTLKFSFDKLKILLSYSIPLVPSTLLVFSTIYIDRFVIVYFLGYEELGLFSFAYRISSVIMLVFTGIQAALMPIVFSSYQNAETSGHISILFNFVMAGSLLLHMILSVFASEIMNMIAGPGYQGAKVLVPFLTTSIVFSNCYIFFPGLFIAKKTLLVSTINMVSTVLKISACFLILPQGGILSIVIIAAVVSGISAFLFYSYGNRYYYTKVNWLKLLEVFIAISVLCAGVFGLESQGYFKENIIILKCICVVIGSALIYFRLDIKLTGMNLIYAICQK